MVDFAASFAIAIGLDSQHWLSDRRLQGRGMAAIAAVVVSTGVDFLASSMQPWHITMVLLAIDSSCWLVIDFHS